VGYSREGHATQKRMAVKTRRNRPSVAEGA
jgi:hypothetical protein